MTDPSTSKYQQSADPQSTYQPDISPSDNGYSDEQHALATYQGIYGTQGGPTWGQQNGPQGPTSVPTLSMAYAAAPDLVPVPGTANSVGAGASGPTPSLPIHIDLGVLMATEQSFLGATKTLVDSYESTLLPTLQNAINDPSIWGTNVTTKYYMSSDTPASPSTPPPVWPQDPLDQEGQQFRTQITPALQQLLNSVGSVLEAMGVFTSLINTAGQYYTQADFQSLFPPPGLMEGPNPPTGP